MPPILPSTQRAVIASPTGDIVVSDAVPVIELEEDSIIIKTVAVALNPVDTKLVGDFVTPGAIFGFDCAGIVFAVGSEVTRDIKPGDRVCGAADGMNRARPFAGAFAEFVSLPGELALKIPDNLTFEQAATFGTALASAGIALFYSLGLPRSLLDKPAEKPFPVLVYGGSTATGTITIQLLKICGLIPIATCSPKNFDFVKSCGAEAVFDYSSPSCAADIKAYTRNALDYAFDCITQHATMKLCYASLGRAGGKYTALDPYPTELHNRKAVIPDWILATKITGRGTSWPAPWECEGDEELKKFAPGLFTSIQRLFGEGKIKPHPQRVCGGGLPGILDGIREIKMGEVSGFKLVYPLA